jgi:hypothetical protein
LSSSTTAPGSISAELKQIWSSSKLELPSTPAGKAEYYARRKAEPLQHLLEEQQNIWQDTMEKAVTYPPKEAAKHAQRLKTYVAAAAARAAGQLEPGLKGRLYGALMIES